MKKALAYTLAAVFIGVATMLAPFALFTGESRSYEPLMLDQQPPPPLSFAESMRNRPSEIEKIYGIAPATLAPDFLFLVFMLALSLVTAFGVMRYLRRKTSF
ncbi:MAG: hypothetical protein PVF15_07660 [Candidatus Bathyarchaeota archaeon]